MIYPMEMHVVHFKSSYITQERALREKDGLVVLVYFFKVQEQSNPSMQSIIDVIPEVQNAHTSVHIKPRAISYFVRPFAKNYLMYWGSVMTSSCSHRILWLISREPIGISSDQMENFRMLKDSSGKPIKHHSRDAQPVQGRSLFLVNGAPSQEEALLPIPSKPSSVISMLGPGYTNTAGDVSNEPEYETSKEQEEENYIPYQQYSAFCVPNTVTTGNPFQKSYNKGSKDRTRQSQTYPYDGNYLREESWTLSSNSTLLQPSVSFKDDKDEYKLHNQCQFTQTLPDSSKSFDRPSNIMSVRTQTSDCVSLDNCSRRSRQRREDVCTQVPSSMDTKRCRSKKKCTLHKSKHRQRYVWPYKYIRACSYLQIPVNIIPRHVPGKHFPPLEIGNLVSSRGYATIVNTGESVEIKLHGRSLPLLQGGPLDDIYVFSHVHFHWNQEECCNSELTFDGYSVEAHAVFHKHCYKSVDEAGETENGLVIVAAFLQETEVYNWEFEKVSSKLRYIKLPNTNIELPPDALSWMDKLGTNGYYTYPGSRENRSASSIIWILYPEPISISHSQISLLE